MTPLAPLYLLAALAVAGPILFHLWRRTPRGRREFSTLMFLAPSPPRVTSRSRIEHWLLLILRGAVLCLLALAFARPLWRTAISGPEQPADELVAVLVDTSASLRRDGAWTDLMRQVKSQISRLPPTTTVGLFRFDDRWSAVADFAELKRLGIAERRELITSRLADLKPGWGGTNLGEALARCASALQESQTDRAVPAKLRIVLATDLQLGANLDGLNGFEWPKDLRLELLVARASSPTNAGLQWVDRNLDLADDVQRVKVVNAADSRKEQFTLKWSGPSGDATAQSVYVPPGQSRVIVAPKRPKEAQSSSLALTGDDNSFDNTLYIAPPRDETRLVVYFGTDRPDDPAGLRFYLQGVYSASQRYRIDVRSWQEALTASKADRPTLVVLAEPEPDAGDFMQTFLAQGGTILVAARNADSAMVSLKQCGLDELNVTEATVRRDAMLANIDFEHPLFAPFAEAQFSDFTGIRFWKHRSLAGYAGTNAKINKGPHGGSVLARFDDLDPALVEFKTGKGTVWLLTGGWNPADSQLARSSKFPPLMFRMLEHASGTTTRAQNLAVNQPISWPRPDDLATTKGTIRTPDGASLKDQSIDSPFTDTQAPGLYSLEVGGKTDVVAINLAPDESRTSPLPMEQLEGLGVRLGSAESPDEIRLTKERERQLQIEELEHTQKLWRWGVLTAIVLLLLETWLAGRRTASADNELPQSTNQKAPT